MSGTATLTRAPTAAPSTFATSLAAPPRLASLRGALVVATFAMACMSTETAKQLVLSFDGTVSTLGKASSYWDASGHAARLAARHRGALPRLPGGRAAVGASRAVRVGITVAAIGTVLLALAAACSVWATAVYNHATIGGGGVLSTTKASTVTHEVVELSKASLAFQAAGFLVLAVGVFTARPQHGRVGVGVAAGALGARCRRAARRDRPGRLVRPGPPGSLDDERAARRAHDDRAARAVLARRRRRAPVRRAGARGERADARGSASPRRSARSARSSSRSRPRRSSPSTSWCSRARASGWLTDVTRINSAAAWAGWLALTVAFGVAATQAQGARGPRGVPRARPVSVTSAPRRRAIAPRRSTRGDRHRPAAGARPAASATAPAPSSPIELVRSRSYLALVVLGAAIGVPISVVAYFFLKLVSEAQTWVFVTAPGDLGLHPVPAWWPLVPLFVSGLVVALTIEHLHGTAGHKPAEGFKAAGAVDPLDLPGIVLASLATLCLGAVLGPEAPLIAIGSGLGVLAVHLVKRDAPPMAALVIGAAGSFAAIATLLGSPIVGAFLLMEAGGLGGPMLGVRARARASWPPASARSSSSGWTPGRASGPSRSASGRSRPSRRPPWGSSAGPSPSASSPRCSARSSVEGRSSHSPSSSAEGSCSRPLVGLARRGHRDPLRRGDGQGLVLRPVLRPGPAARARAARGDLVGRHRRAAPRLQGRRL